MRERYSMLLSAPLLVPEALILILLRTALEPADFKTYCCELRDAIVWSWNN